MEQLFRLFLTITLIAPSLPAKADPQKVACAELVSLLDLPPQPRMDLVPIESRDIIPLNKPKSQIAPDTYMGEFVTEELVNAELIHSDFFKQLLETANSPQWKGRLSFEFDSFEKINFLSADKNNELASLLYEIMKFELTRVSDLVNKFSNPEFSQKTFFKHSKEYIIDKIGEALIVSSKYKNYSSFAQIKKHRRKKVPDGESALKGVGGFIAAAGIIGVLKEPSLIFIVSSISGLLIWGHGLVQTKKRTDGADDYARKEILEAHRTAVKNRGIPSGPIVELHPDEYREHLALIEEEIRALKSRERIPMEDNLTIFGNDALDLKASLNKVYHSDLMKWFQIHSQFSGDIRQRIEELREGKIATTQARKDTLNFLKKVMIEALEATVETERLSQQVIEIIDGDLRSLRNYNPPHGDPEIETKVSSFRERALLRNIQKLRLAKVVHIGFVEQLNIVHLTLSQILESLDSLSVAESAARNKKMGIFANEALENLKSGLDSLDSHLELFPN